jgi:hypothetical protein
VSTARADPMVALATPHWPCAPPSCPLHAGTCFCMLFESWPQPLSHQPSSCQACCSYHEGEATCLSGWPGSCLEEARTVILTPGLLHLALCLWEEEAQGGGQETGSPPGMSHLLCCTPLPPRPSIPEGSPRVTWAAADLIFQSRDPTLCCQGRGCVHVARPVPC